MAKATLTLDAEQVGILGLKAYLGDPRFGRSALRPGGGGLIHRSQDMAPAWDSIRNVLFHAEALLFQTEGASGDQSDPDIPWAELGWGPKHRYAWWRYKYFPGPILQLSGALMRQLTGQSGDHYERRARMRFVFGSNAPVGRWSGKRTSMYEGGIGGLKHEGEAWSLDPDDEDVGGLHAEGGFVHRRPDGNVSDPDPARPPISISDQDEEDMTETILDHITAAARVQGAFNPFTRRFTGMLRRLSGTPLIANAGRVFKSTKTGRRRRIGTI